MKATEKKSEKEGKVKVLTFLIAPDIPASELKFLESHWAECLRDPAYTLVTNYELRVDVVTVSSSDHLLAVAPDIPPKEVLKLQKTISGMRKGTKPAYKAFNYELSIFTIPR